MTCQIDFTQSEKKPLSLPEGLLEELFKQLYSQDPTAYQNTLLTLLNACMRAERQEFLGADKHERTPSRIGYANGFKPKTVRTRLGELTVAIPQVRDSSFYPSALERGLRSERALTLALAEMYVQGVSTRKVAAITEKLCGTSISSSMVSRAAAELDKALSAWRERSLSACPYVYFDARYEKVRQNSAVQDAAVLIALGVDMDGRRRILGVSISLSEQEVHWRQFFQSMVQRGLTGVQLIVSDDHAGLKAARRAVFGSVPWQRCQFHLQQNASAYVPKQEMKLDVASTIRGIFNAEDLSCAETLLKAAVTKYAKSAPKLATWMEENLHEGFMVFSLPSAHRRLLRTTNALERLNEEIRRRTRVARIFPNEASCLRLISAILMEKSENWETGKVYLTPTTDI